MGPYKALGPDGYQPVFYQKLWRIFGHDLISVVLNCLNVGFLPRDLNNTLLVLIPKVASPKTIKQFRPISLCNVAYKTITKAIVNRLKPLLPQVISPNQTSFILRRNISNNMIVY